jgi:hypothetical protein
MCITCMLIEKRRKRGGVGEAATEWSEVVVAEQTKLQICEPVPEACSSRSHSRIRLNATRNILNREYIQVDLGIGYLPDRP